MLADYYLMEINFLFYTFVINSALTFSVSHVLHMRGCIIRQAPLNTARCFQLLTIGRFTVLVLLVFLGPFFVKDDKLY